jgi:short-subunit dehydrogenase
MRERNTGKILNIASTASFQPIPRFAVYAATKSYVLNFTEALYNEVKGSGVSVSVLCPGPTETGFEKSANIKNSNLFKGKLMDTGLVAKIGYKGLMIEKMTIIPGFKNKLLAFFSNISPSRNLLVWISGKIS